MVICGGFLGFLSLVGFFVFLTLALCSFSLRWLPFSLRFLFTNTDTGIWVYRFLPRLVVSPFPQSRFNLAMELPVVFVEDECLAISFRFAPLRSYCLDFFALFHHNHYVVTFNRYSERCALEKIRRCRRCGTPLNRYNPADICYPCQEEMEGVLNQELAPLDWRLSVRELASRLSLSQGHLRRILEHPEKYPWRSYGIIEAYKSGKNWAIFCTQLEHRKQLSEQLISIGEGALNCIRINAMLGFGAVLTCSDMQSLIECQINSPPQRKTTYERERQRRRLAEELRRDPDRLADRFFAAVAPLVEEKLKEARLLRTIALTDRQLRTLDAGHEHRRQPNLNSAGS